MRQSSRSPRDQPSLFGVAASEPQQADLAGLLVGPGTVHRMGGTARITVPVDAAWRVHVLVAELTGRGLTTHWAEAGSGGFRVRTAYAAGLVRLAEVWQDGVPARVRLTGHGLRLWVAAAGSPVPPRPHPGHLLPLGSDRAEDWAVVGGALSAIGVGAALVVPAGGGTAAAYRVTGRRRLARLAELVGDPPPAAPAGAWPGSPPG